MKRLVFASLGGALIVLSAFHLRLTHAQPPSDTERRDSSGLQVLDEATATRLDAFDRKLDAQDPLTAKFRSILSSPDGRIVLAGALNEFAGQARFVYEHTWSPDDIVMWDNRCTMHYVTPHDPTERRVMHRTTIAGDAIVEAA